MAKKHIDTSLVKINTSLPDNIFGLSDVLKHHGWDVQIKTDTFINNLCASRVSVSRNSWLDMVIPYYGFAYMSKDNSEESITQSLLKLASLCLEMEIIFSGSYPAMNVSDDGIIYEDENLTDAAKIGQDAVLLYLNESRSLTSKIKGKILFFKHGFIHINWDSQDIILTCKEVDSLEALINE